MYIRAGIRAATAAALLSASSVGLADELLDGAEARLSAGEAEAAFQLLAPLNDERAGEARYDYLLGLSAMDTGRLTEAMFALERAVAVEPENPRYRAELARCHFLLREKDEAARQFARINTDEVPDAARAAIQRYLDALDVGYVDWPEGRGYISLTMGYDSNANSGTAARYFGSGRITSGREVDAWFARLEGGGSYTHPLTANTAVVGNLNASSTVLDHVPNLESSALIGNVGLRHKSGKDSYTAAVQANIVTSGHEAFYHGIGLTAQATHSPTAAEQYAIFGQLTENSYTHNHKRDSWTMVSGIGYSTLLDLPSKPVVYISGYAGRNRSISDPAYPGNDYEDYLQLGLRGGGRMRFNQDWTGFFSVNAEQRMYNEANRPGTNGERRDHQYGLGVGANYVPFKDWSIRPELSLTKNDSNIVINEYDRATVSVTVSRDFK